jgi:hypothetical protein
MDARFPSFPFLVDLRLADVYASNLYGLLSKCAPTLRLLCLHGVKSDPPTKFLPAPVSGVVKDALPVLCFPRLTWMEICSTSPFWVAPQVNSSSFLAEAPLLDNISFAAQNVFDADRAARNGKWQTHSPCTSLTAQVLTSLFRTSPKLRRLELNGTNVTLDMLSASLPHASPTLSELHLCDVASDALINHLDIHVPNLEYLDVRTDQPGTRITVPPPVSLAYIARLPPSLGKVPRTRRPSQSPTSSVCSLSPTNPLQPPRSMRCRTSSVDYSFHFRQPKSSTYRFTSSSTVLPMHPPSPNKNKKSSTSGVRTPFLPRSTYWSRPSRA